ncbi:hypothetical protein KY495_06820 [Massilia sp. PAMC28688]|uniref:hypothetical protein n=1 Tax=Massilia sp. PAMC28688 TaxID=2861283 RepID=UPI001C633EE1|nr:hypothetical protein [Massilia sp. PAMC28688]QYF94889.1 hypothetical protein KY495_06820 [Massilia sp. PAMC28688]
MTIFENRCHMPRLACLLTGLLLPLAAPAQNLISSLEGVYKTRGQSGIVMGPGTEDEIVQVEDVLEIVRYDDRRAYFRTRLNFYNGHKCALWGIAEQRGSELFYQQTADIYPGLPVCALKIKRVGGTVKLTDYWDENLSTSCSVHCGARGSFSNVSFTLASKRPIRYLKRMKGASEYKEAVAELQGKLSVR